jgi:hypothetical protein
MPWGHILSPGMQGKRGVRDAVLDDLDLSRITDPEARRVLGVLLQLVERQAAQIALLEAENRRLRDENNRLKGEQGKPTILPNKRREAADHSSERERRGPPQAWQKEAKLPHVRIDRTEERRLERGSLPEDAQFKGYAEVVAQDLALRTDTVLFRCERWYSPGLHESYQAPLPAGYRGQFGPGVAALGLYLCYQANMSQAKLLELFGSVGLSMSAGHLATLLTEQPELAAEYDAIGRAALASSSYQHLDETPTRVDGVEEHCHVLDSPLATVYRTTPGKDRQAAIDVLRLGGPRRFRFNLHAWAYLAEVPLSAATRASLAAWPQGVDLDEATFLGLLAAHLPKVGEQQRRQIVDAAAIGAYRAQQDVPVVETLVVDDAPQWKGITADRALCWVHEGRHYTKLDPCVPAHRQLLDDFRRDFWSYYRDLAAYREQPSASEAARLSLAFDALFRRVTGYAALDERIAKTRAKKAALLRVLDHPELPLHNNPAELGARRRVRKRDVSFGARSPAGIRAWDCCHTITATAQKLGVNVLHYLQDRLSGARQLPALADLIAQRAAESSAMLAAAA